jgi:hypothetical protein
VRAPTLLLIALLGVTCAHDSSASLLSGALSLVGLGKKEEKPVTAKPFVDDTKRTLQDRLEHPNLEKSFDPTKGSPVSNRSVTARKASSKEFSTRSFSAREFYSRDFHGAKQANLGKDKVETPSAPTKGRNEIPNLDAKTPAKAVAVKPTWDAEKKVDTRTASASGREFLVKGRSQDRLDIEKNQPRGTSTPIGYTGDLKSLTIQDIRELLNKNK